MIPKWNKLKKTTFDDVVIGQEFYTEGRMPPNIICDLVECKKVTIDTMMHYNKRAKKTIFYPVDSDEIVYIRTG